MRDLLLNSTLTNTTVDRGVLQRFLWPWHRVDIGRDVIGLLRGQRAGVVLRHGVRDEGGHLGRIVHTGAVVVGVVAPQCRSGRRQSFTVDTMAHSAVICIDHLAADRIALWRRKLDETAALEGLALYLVPREPADVCHERLHLRGVLRERLA